MKQNLHNVEPSETIRIVRTDAANLQTDAANLQNLHDERISVTAEEQRRNVTAALEMRRVSERRARLRKRVFVGLTGTLMAILGVAALYDYRAAPPAAVVAPMYQTTAVASPVSAMDSVAADGELRMIPLSAVTNGTTAYADFGTIAALAQGKKGVNLIVSANRPFSSQSGPIHGLWEVIPGADGYKIGVYARPDAALRAANGGSATLHSEIQDGLVHTEIPVKRLSGVPRAQSRQDSGGGESVELPPTK